GPLDDEPGERANDYRNDDGEKPEGGKDDEPQVRGAGELRGRRIRLPRDPVDEPHAVLDDERESESEEQVVRGGQVIEPADQRALEDHSKQADRERRDQERLPEAQPEAFP